MDNNSYEQQFIRNVKQTARPTPPKNTNISTPSSTKLPLIVAIVLAVTLLIESVVLIIFVVNSFDFEEEDYDDEETYANDSPEALSENSNFEYDNNYHITAFNLSCDTEEGAKYTFDKSGVYQKTDKSSNLVDSGIYSITNDTAVILKNAETSSQERIVYYDGYSIVEGLTFYYCD